MREFIRHFDTKITESVVQLPASFHGFFLLVTNLGHPIVTMSIGAAIAVMSGIQSNVRLALSGAVVWVALGVGSLLKLLFNRSRPLTEYAANIWLDKLSFPSGHTTGATVAYGLLALLAWQFLPQPWNYIATILLGIFVVLVGVSRIYLGAHFPSDVIAGWLLGGLALIVIVFIIKPFSAS